LESAGKKGVLLGEKGGGHRNRKIRNVVVLFLKSRTVLRARKKGEGANLGGYQRKFTKRAEGGTWRGEEYTPAH